LRTSLATLFASATVTLPSVSKWKDRVRRSRFSIAMMAASGIEARGFALGGHGEKHILRAAVQCGRAFSRLFSELSRAQELSLP
jgi:hypothetical protein